MQGRQSVDQTKAKLPCPTSHCRWGHAHLGGMQRILRDRVFQGGTIAVASAMDGQAPGGTHGAVLLDVIIALQNLHRGPDQWTS